MSNSFFHSEWERQLAHALSEHGVEVVSEFKVPGSKYVLDFFLPAPPFGVVEVCGGVSWGGISSLRPKLDQLEAQVQLLREHLGGGVRLYLVVVGDGKSRTETPQDCPKGAVIFYSDSGRIEPVGALIAEDFRAHSIHLSAKPVLPRFAEALSTDKDDLSQTLSSLILNLNYLFLAEGRKVLEHEYFRLRDEISHEHYTAAALRVGRSVEYIIYSACQSWGVPVREPVLVGLKKLDGRFRELTDALLVYSAIEADAGKKKEAKKKFVSKTSELQNALNQIMSDIDENVAVLPEERKSPINPGALLMDIRTRYAKLGEVRDAIDAQKKPLRDLLDFRNSAAHASLEGGAQEVTRTELRKMIGLLNEVLLSLSKCGTAIDLDRKKQGGAMP